MALSPQLQQFKSSGVYRLEFDKSQTVNIPAETIRLVVGHSKKGPYNTPVFIEDTEQFVAVFGSIDNSLERKGMFFHRSALTALSRGPILALNLTTEDTNDTLEFVSPVTDGGEQGLSAIFGSDEFSKIFDKDKFWTPKDANLLSIAGNTSASSTHAISFANIKQDPITIIVRQAVNTAGFEVTAREWYGEGNLPEGVNELDYVSDYMVDVLVFKGLFDAQALNNDPVYGTHFTNEGLLKSQLSAFTAMREVSLIASYTGSLIPEFMDNEGRQLYIETLINIEARRTGLFCAVNEDAIDAMNLIGEGFDIYQDYQLLSHNVAQKESVNETMTLPNQGKVVEIAANGNMIIYGTTENALNALNPTIAEGKWLKSSVAGEYVQITDITDDGVNATITTTGDFPIDKATYEKYTPVGVPASWTPAASITVNAAGELIVNATGITNGDVVAGAYLMSANAGEYVKIATINDDGVKTTYTPDGNGMFSSTYATASATSLSAYQPTTNGAFVIVSIDENDRVELVPTGAWTFTDEGAGRFTFQKTVIVSASEPVFNSNIKVGMYMPVNGNTGALARILQIQKLPVLDNGVDKTYTYRFITHRNMPVEPEFALKRYDDATTTYTMFPLAGATQSEKKIADLLAKLRPGNGLSNTLVDKDAITFRYVVDTFGSLEDNVILNKAEMTLLCKERENASAIINAPMVKELKASTNPSFLNADTGAFETRHIATGGNLDLNPTALYTLPSIQDGSTFGFYYAPGLNILENGRTKVVPPAAYVSNNYIDKYTDALPWSIIAGPRRGVVSGAGVQSVEYAFDKNDRDVLEPFGINPIVFERGVGLTIKGNKTAQQSIQSALSSAHVREAMIYIEDGLAEILKNYLFEFNNAQTRLEIKTLADNFMESVKKDGGVYDYRNIMDSTNNTNEVIDNNMGILDTYVEPVKGLEILVSRVTILNTGEIATGNFA
jgi:hypothetical protein